MSQMRRRFEQSGKIFSRVGDSKRLFTGHFLASLLSKRVSAVNFVIGTWSFAKHKLPAEAEPLTWRLAVVALNHLHNRIRGLVVHSLTDILISRYEIHICKVSILIIKL